MKLRPAQQRALVLAFDHGDFHALTWTTPGEYQRSVTRQTLDTLVKARLIKIVDPGSCGKPVYRLTTSGLREASRLIMLDVWANWSKWNDDERTGMEG